MINLSKLVYPLLLMLPINKKEDKVVLDTLIPVEYKPEIKKDTISLWRTSYKVQERIYNVTRYVAWKNIKINDKFSVPNFIALRRKTAEKLNLELGAKLTFILPNGDKVVKVFADYMSDKGKFNVINSNRVDFMINADEKFISHEVKLILP